MHPGIPRRSSAVGMLAVLALVLQGLLGSATASTAPGDTGTGDTGTGDPGTSVPGDTQPTSVRVASLNVLGAGHTSKKGNKAGRGWASGSQRMQWAVQLIQRNNLDVVGLQEFESPQYSTFMRLAGDQFGVYPGDQLGNMAMRDSIVWRKSTWELVEAHWMKVPYFYGNPVKMPYVLLRNVQTGRLAWFFNTHNPADARGKAAKYRLQGYRLEWALQKRLRSEYPDVPFFSTGDKNARDPYLCPTVRNSDLKAANGSTATASSCRLAKPSRIDWVMATSDVRFSGYRDIRDALVKKTTDHHLVYADAQIPSADSETSPIDHVVMVSIDGLRPATIEQLGTSGTPNLHRMMAQGASTLDARTDYSSVKRQSNAVGMLTGLRTYPGNGGHGIGWPKRTQSSIEAAAGRYVPGVFDMSHDLGLKTAVVTGWSAMKVLQNSWGSTRGATDRYAPNDGRNKLSRFLLLSRDRDVIAKALGVIGGDEPTVTYVQLSDVADSGAKYGWSSNHYLKAVKRADKRVGQILALTASDRGLAGHTAVIVTAERGGSSARTGLNKRPAWYTVPVFVTGPGVAAGADLYALNPQLADPGRTRPSYARSVVQPVRTSYLANLVTKMLGQPALPGSDQNQAQDFTVFAPPAS
ncbi:MAG TPA: alkaline phosphatase family protein [Marmoricola sp.]|nr:alkaline phosphatase family protein [Marmoricola sp.]